MKEVSKCIAEKEKTNDGEASKYKSYTVESKRSSKL